MKQRSPIAVFLLPFVTFGIYSLVWQVKTKNEMNQQGAQIPTAWLLVVPFVGYYWLWKYSEGVEKVTDGTLSGVLAFVLQALLGSIGQAIIQNEFNKPLTTVTSGAPDQSFIAPGAEAPMAVTYSPQQITQPDTSFGGPVTTVPPLPQTIAPSQPSTAPQTFEPSPAPIFTPTPTDSNNAQPPQQS